MTTTPPAPALPATRGQIVAWGLWDWGSSAYNAVILTFVFSVYLTDAVGSDLPGDVNANSWLGYSIGAAGLLIALMAPVIGRSADTAGHRKLSVGVWTALTVATVAALFLVQDDYHYLWLGLLLLGLGSIFFELASVSYNAMLTQVSTPSTIGRVSAFGWSMGYLGGIVLLLVVYIGFISGDGGVLGVPTENGFNIRLVALVAAGWFLVFAIPMFYAVPESPARTQQAPRLGIIGSYRALFHDLRDLYRTSPHTVYFLAASALFRDGLAAIFTFGAVLAVTVYGIGAGDVLIFGVAANVVSAVGALAAGRIDDRTGPKAVIMGSLAGMLAVGIVLLFVSGPTMFWIFGLLLTLFVGPAQSSSRTYLARLAPTGQEGQLFGLYATTGRAVSFLAPTLVGLFTYLFGSDRAGIVGILLVLGVGLLALWPVRPPATTTV
ncbi:MFS transporter [Pseudonocardia xinjiangensis]|uniref:MFS transporter n=1 Tax=Pseudonocardia xinjiangensis TaxID=75289 RepID=A0ABX1REX0_9PSEU|nr:MFS transporter [Pseudonocardia xinjiangensis]NMH77660.1 MFS transporter [Pseudonocardia xinjiangensis]